MKTHEFLIAFLGLSAGLLLVFYGGLLSGKIQICDEAHYKKIQLESCGEL